MPYNSARALELLRLGTQDPAATFREHQEDAIQHVVDGYHRLLVVQKTGWGKSSVYFIATKLLREEGAGPVLLISPLLSLMRNQIAAAARMGVRAARFSSDNKDDWDAEAAKLHKGEIDIVLSTPEQLTNERFNADVLGPVAARISLLVIDEAHCISDWGHDFRPHYRLIQRRMATLPRNVRVLATTATANNRVLADLEMVLGPGLKVSRGDLSRPSLFLQTIVLPSQAERLAWLAEQVGTLAGHGIIYTLTVRDAEQVAAWLKQRGLNVQAYHSELAPARSHALEDALLANQVKALVSTTKLGMGFDKPDLAFVIHYQTPGSVVHYYQQVGRAGRALTAAYGVLLSGQEEIKITDYFRDKAFPSRQEVAQLFGALEAAPNGLSIYELMERVNLSFGRIEKALFLLSLESVPPVVKQGRKWTLTVAPINDAFWQRAEAITALRRAEQEQMQEYVRLASGHMEFLIRALDGDPGAFQPPALPPLPATAGTTLVQEAVAFLQRSNLPLVRRQQWPVGGLPPGEEKRKIPENNRAQPGKVLCVWGDAGWGALIRDGKYRDGRFTEALVEACVKLVRQWSPQPAPVWVTCIPSRSHPNLVPDFARRLAAALNLRFDDALEKTGDRPPQKEMENSSQQARNVHGSFSVKTSPLPAGSVLLVDDMVDSGWTLTVAAYVLTSHGSGLVYPLALASTAHAE